MKSAVFLILTIFIGNAVAKVEEISLLSVYRLTFNSAGDAENVVFRLFIETAEEIKCLEKTTPYTSTVEAANFTARFQVISDDQPIHFAVWELKGDKTEAIGSGTGNDGQIVMNKQFEKDWSTWCDHMPWPETGGDGSVNPD